jgi:hypothetical protein
MTLKKETLPPHHPDCITRPDIAFAFNYLPGYEAQEIAAERRGKCRKLRMQHTIQELTSTKHSLSLSVGGKYQITPGVEYKNAMTRHHHVTSPKPI